MINIQKHYNGISGVYVARHWNKVASAVLNQIGLCMTHFLKVVITEWSTTRSGSDVFPVAVNCGQASVLPGFNLTLDCNPGRENGCSGSSSGSSSGFLSELCRRVLVFRALRCCSGSARNDFPADGRILAGYIIRWGGKKDILLRRRGWV